MERRYQGSRVAHAAATVIQSAWRDHVLRRRLRRMVSLAQSVENIALGRRLSGLELDQAPPPGEVTAAAEAGCSPAARHIQSRRHLRRHNGGHMAVTRSASLRDHRRSGSWSGGFQPIDTADRHTPELPDPAEAAAPPQPEPRNTLKPSNSWSETSGRPQPRPRTAAELQNCLNTARDLATADTADRRPLEDSVSCSPVPPCPPLRGRHFYPEEPGWFPRPAAAMRDSVYCSVRRPRRLPPRVPQRTVSFLGQEPAAPAAQVTSLTSLPRELDSLYTSRAAPASVSASCLAAVSAVSHARTQSTPCPGHTKVSPLPPPPYVSPPSVQHRDPNEPLPPPPELETVPPCDSSSSIDSGFR